MTSPNPMILAESFEDISPALVRRLLAEGVDPNTIDSTGRPIIVAAAEEELMESVCDLLNAGADPNAQDEMGRRALHYAAGDPATAKHLLMSGADPNACDRNGYPPLDSLLRIGHYNDDCRAHLETCVAIFLDAGANIGPWTNRVGQLIVPLNVALRNPDDRPGLIARLIAAGAEPNVGDGILLPIHCAAIHQAVASLRVLLASGADPNAIEARHGKRPLHLLAENDLSWETHRAKAQETARVLLAGGADLDARDGRGITARECLLERVSAHELLGIIAP